MDFEKILHMAKKNQLTKREPVKCLPTKFKPPTKEQHDKDKVLSEGVQKFLARKEEEEKRKQMEAERRKRELMALRAKDPKANRRIQTMLKRTKSANKSVMEDAIDDNNTADTLAGPLQPDEDDYGFVSETSSQMYNKLIQKMYSTPDDSPKFSPSKRPTGGNLSNTKERVKLALLRQEEEERSPHKRKRKGKDRVDDEEDDVRLDYSAPDRDLSKPSSEHNKEKPEKPKVKKPAPPPLDFHQLLKIAEQKQHEPIVFEPKVKKPQEPEVLMTKKQKLEHERMQEWRRQREHKLQNLENGEKSSSGQEDKRQIPRIPKINQSSSDPKPTTSSSSSRKLNGHDDRVNSKMGPKGQDKNDRNDRNSIPNRLKDLNGKNPKPKPGGDKKLSSHSAVDREYKDINDETERLIRERDEALRILKEKEKLIRERDEAVRKLKEKEQLIRERDEAVRKLKLLEESEKARNSPKDSVKLSDSSNSKSGIASQKGVNSKTPIKNSEIPTCSTSRSDFRNSANKCNTPVVNKNGLGKSTSSTTLGNGLGRSSSSTTLGNGLGRSKAEGKGVSERSGVREFPPKDMRGGNREAAMRNLQPSRQFPPADVSRRGLAVKRRRIESDDEYDSELDDFIDDDDNDVRSEEVSKMISEIFKYDKNKYSKYDDADDECMESNFAQISKEEFFSAKCGLIEDLRDIQREKAMSARRRKR